MTEFGGIPGTNVPQPCINMIKIDEKSDFILLGCKFLFFYFIVNLGDGIYDRLENEKILNKIWSYKKAGVIFKDIHALCGQIVDAIIKYSMEKNSEDNVTVIFVAFKNFENKMKDPNFEYKGNNIICRMIKEDYDFSIN